MDVEGDNVSREIVSVLTYGKAPDRIYYVRLQIGNQGFDIGRRFAEGEEEPEESAESMASMLRKALTKFVTDLVIDEPPLVPSDIPADLARMDRGDLVRETLAAVQRRILERLSAGLK